MLGFSRLGRYPILGMPAYGALSILACTLALFDLLRGRSVSVWDTRRMPA